MGVSSSLVLSIKHPILARTASKIGNISLPTLALAQRIKIKGWTNYHQAFYTEDQDIPTKRHLLFAFLGDRSRIKLSIAQTLINNKVQVQKSGAIKVTIFSESKEYVGHVGSDDVGKLFHILGFVFEGKNYYFKSPVRIMNGTLDLTRATIEPKYFVQP